MPEVNLMNAGVCFMRALEIYEQIHPKQFEVVGGVKRDAHPNVIYVRKHVYISDALEAVLIVCTNEKDQVDDDMVLVVLQLLLEHIKSSSS